MVGRGRVIAGERRGLTEREFSQGLSADLAQALRGGKSNPPRLLEPGEHREQPGAPEQCKRLGVRRECGIECPERLVRRPRSGEQWSVETDQAERDCACEAQVATGLFLCLRPFFEPALQVRGYAEV